LIGEYSELDDDLKFELTRALWSAEETGAFDQLYECVSFAINAIAEELGATVEYDDFDSISLKITLQEYLSFLAKHIEEHIGLKDFNYEADAFEASIQALTEETSEYVETDLEIPYYGFQGYCDSVAEGDVSEVIASLTKSLAVAA
jgi:hypothetical protein